MKPTRVKSALRYMGAKWNLAPWIISHMPAHRVYTDAFGGSGAVLLQKPRARSEIYNDLWEDIVGFFRVVRDPESAAELKRLLELTPFARKEFEAAFTRSEQPIENARRMVIRSFMGFGADSLTIRNTGFRADSKKSGSTPMADWVRYPERIDAICQRLRGVTIECLPATEVILTHDTEETLHYVDPPYVHSTRSRGNPYDKKHLYAHELSDDDHRELLMLLRSVKGYVLLSGYATDMYEELLPDWTRLSKSTHADGARDRVECLWLSPRTARATQLFSEVA